MGSLKGLDARKAAMVMGIMTLHAFSEGLGVGVSYGGANGRRQVCVCVCVGGGRRSPRALAPALIHSFALRVSIDQRLAVAGVCPWSSTSTPLSPS